MKVVKAMSPGNLQIMEVPRPDPGRGEVLIAVRASGICGSDKWFWQVPKPTENIAGHEVAGKVVAVGEDVHHLAVGDRVSINNVKGCGECPECRAGRFVRCSRSITHMGHGFSEFVVAPERNCLLLDEKISYEEGCLIFDNWGTPYAAIERAGIVEGNYVVVSGCGPIGLGAVALAKLFGAYVIALDPIEGRRKKALEVGADKAFPPGGDIVSVVKEITSGIGADIILECSGKGQAYETSFSMVRIGGTLVSIGEGAKFECRPSEMLIPKHLNFLGTLYSSMEHGAKIQDLMVRGLINPLCFVSHTFSLEELPNVFGKVFNSEEGIFKTMVVIPES